MMQRILFFRHCRFVSRKPVRRRNAATHASVPLHVGPPTWLRRPAFLFGSVLVAAVVLTGLIAPVRADNNAQLSQVKTLVGVRWDLMQIIRSTHANAFASTDTTWLNRFWMQSIKSTLSMHAFVGSHLELRIRYFGVVQFTVPGSSENRVQEYNGGGGIDEAYAAYRFANADTSALRLTIGYFPFEYTHAWQRLGSYLFHTSVYPGYIISAFSEKPVMGMALSVRLPLAFRHDLFALIENEQEPHNDITLAYLGRLQAGGLEIGGACMLHRVLRTDQGYYKYTQTKPQFRVPGSSDDNPVYYRKAGIKAVGRVAYDIKSLVGQHRLGENDLKVYAEAAVLGVKDYAGYYNEITERIPVMAGITLPVFGILDVAGVEVEWYGSRWKNNPTSMSLPIPIESFEPRVYGAGFEFITDPQNQDAGEKAYKDNLKWAFFIEKTIRERLSICAHAASDHFRAPLRERWQNEELLHGPDEWYWQLSLISRF